MKIWINTKIRTKLILCFLIIGLITSFVGIFGLFNMSKTNKNSIYIYEKNLLPVTYLYQVQKNLTLIRANFLLMAYEKNTSKFSSRNEEINAWTKEDNELLEKFLELTLTDEEEILYSKLKIDLTPYRETRAKIIKLIEGKSYLEADGLMPSFSEQSAIVDKDIQNLIGEKLTASQNTINESQMGFRFSFFIMMFFIALGFLLATGFGFFIGGNISKPIKKLEDAANKLSIGDTNISIESKGKDEIGNLMNSFHKMIENIKEQSINAKKISEGDLSLEVIPKSENDILANSMKLVLKTLNDLVNEAKLITYSAKEGDLKKRGESDKFQGGYREIVEGMNSTLEAVVGPLNVAADYVDRISKGDIPDKILDNYNGDFNLIKNNLNTAIDAINAMVTDVDILVSSAIEGKLSTRADESKHFGDFRKIIDGINTTLDEVIKPLNVASSCVEKFAYGVGFDAVENTYKGDFFILIDNINRLRKSFYILIMEVKKLVKAAIEGDLNKRGDIRELKGSYVTIVGGINDTLDAITKPIEEVKDVIGEISKGNLSVLVKGDYLGDFAILKDSVNNTASSLQRVVGEISDVIGKIAEGDLAIDKIKDYNGDFKNISNSLNNIVDSLNDVLGEINKASEQVSAGSKQVSDSSQALSQGSTEQASSIEEVTAAIAEIASQIKENANNANNANIISTAAKVNATTGKNQMSEMLLAMDEINTSSGNISKIIKVIEDIAFQTNILALNAAVEGARAGQYGKGFAVVAEEVRNLAGRSAEAAKETTNMIEESIKKARAGKKIAEETAGALNKIVENIAKVAGIVGEIAESSKEQATGVAQINQAVEEISKVTQTNTATAEESASASEELLGQAYFLKEKIGKFKLI